jgi:hypothetical protein
LSPHIVNAEEDVDRAQAIPDELARQRNDSEWPIADRAVFGAAKAGTDRQPLRGDLANVPAMGGVAGEDR